MMTLHPLAESDAQSLANVGWGGYLSHMEGYGFFVRLIRKVQE
jgi:hypothetical protein